MIVKNVNDTKDTKIESYPYKNKPYTGKGYMDPVAVPGWPGGRAGVWPAPVHGGPKGLDSNPQSSLLPDDVYPDWAS